METAFLSVAKGTVVMFYALIISKDGQQFNDAACNLKLPVLIGAAHLVLIQKVNALVGLIYAK